MIARVFVGVLNPEQNRNDHDDREDHQRDTSVKKTAASLFRLDLRFSHAALLPPSARGVHAVPRTAPRAASSSALPKRSVPDINHFDRGKRDRPFPASLPK